MSQKIKAVTFDLWDTIIDDDSDEPKRRQRGLRPKPEERRHMVWEALSRRRSIGREEVELAYGVADAAFVKVWKEHAITWTVGERLRVLLNGLGRELPDDELERIAGAMARMEIEVPPETIDGVADAIARLAERYKLCIVSDTIVTPADGLRRLLEIHGLKRHFSGFAFSDEVGRSKPHRAMFDSAAAQLGVSFGEIVHIGDRDHNDVRGSQALGMKAILFTAKRDADKATTTADAVCERHADLPAIVDSLAA